MRHRSRRKDLSLNLIQQNGEQKLGTQGPAHFPQLFCYINKKYKKKDRKNISLSILEREQERGGREREREIEREKRYLDR